MLALVLATAFGGTEHLLTRDGVSLEADVYLGEAGAPGIVLLHMIPPHYDRTSWPEDVIRSYTAKGWSVCVPDRRGAGHSKGKAKQAYKGDKGRYDVEACVKRLAEHGLGKLAIIGASNGTTSMIDYASWALAEQLPVPVWMGFMTGGSYTENNTPITAVSSIPALVLSSTVEREWSSAQGNVEGWTVVEYPEGAHGTKLFGVVPEEVRADLLRALEAALGA